MVTGYTMKLDEGGKSAKDWILEDLARAFGICVMLRDDNSYMSKEEILSKLKDDSSTYHKRGIIEAKTNLVKYATMSENDWQKILDEENLKIVASNMESMRKANELKKLHDKTILDLEKVIEKTSDAITMKVCGFGIQQLNLVEDECKPYISKEQTDLDGFKAGKIEVANRDIEYHTKEEKEQSEREEGRVDSYLKLISEVESILGDGGE